MSQIAQPLFHPAPMLEITLTVYSDRDRVDFSYLRLDGHPLRVSDVRDVLTSVLTHLAPQPVDGVVQISPPTLFAQESV